jgi:hypothetical protein
MEYRKVLIIINIQGQFGQWPQAFYDLTFNKNRYTDQLKSVRGNTELQFTILHLAPEAKKVKRTPSRGGL